MPPALQAGLTALLAVAVSCGSSTTTGNADEQDGGDVAETDGGTTVNGRDGGSLTGGAGGGGGSGGDAGRGTGGIAGGGSGGVAGNGGTGGRDPTLDPMNDPIVNDPACPSMNPAEDTACPEFGLVCKYGEDLSCRSRWACNQVCDPVCGSELRWQQNFAERDCPGLCPQTEPQPGQPCSGSRTLCTYGDDPVCRTEWECRDGSWVALVPPRDCERTDVYCPAEPPISFTCSLAEVTPPDARCVYKYGAICTCNCIWDLGGVGASGLQTHWACFIPSPVTNFLNPTTCPLAAPSPGTPCLGDAECSYAPSDICEMPSSILIVARCVSGFWQVTP